MDNLKKEKINITSIPPNAEINITIGGLYYQRLNKLLIEFADSVDKNTLLSAMYKIKTKISEKDNFAFNLETLIILLHDIEKAFKNGGLTIEQELEVEIPENIQNLKEDFNNFKD